ncbi:MAG: extracellular solute-binding protein [Anaerolineae bacterium]|nr:extracellular solute-binding protein [Anaerolineae bacterium]
MRKVVFMFGLLLVIALFTSAAFAQDDMAGIDPSGQTIVYWHQFTSAQLETMTALVERFNGTNEYGITVEALPQGNYNDIRELMNASIISGELPNLVAGYGNDAASYALDGAAVDLMPYVNDATWGLSEEQQADLLPGFLDANKQTAAPFSGELQVWPHQFSAQVMVSNLELLKALGYDAPPASIDEFREIVCAAAEYTGPNGEDVQGYPITTDASAFESFVASYGGAIFDGTQYQFTSEPVIQALTLYKELYDSGCAYIPAERFSEQTDLALGLTPFNATSTAGFTFVRQAFVDAGHEDPQIGVSTFPHTEGNEIIQVFVPSIIMVPSTPEQQLASWIFLKFLTEAESGAQWSGGTGYFNPVVSSGAMLTADTFANAAIFPYFEAARSILNNPDIRVYNGPQVVSYGTVRGLVSEAIAAVTSNGQDVMPVAEKLNEDANAANSG